VSLWGLKGGYTTTDGSEVGKITGTTYRVSAAGAVSSAVRPGAAKLMKLDPQKMAHAVGLAAHYYLIPSQAMGRRNGCDSPMAFNWQQLAKKARGRPIGRPLLIPERVYELGVRCLRLVQPDLV